MIICPNCLHQNVNHSETCEVCQADLPSTSSCSNCGASIQLGAQFCGQCGCSLTDDQHELDERLAVNFEQSKSESEADNPFLFPDLRPPDPVVMPDLIQIAEPGVEAEADLSQVNELLNFENPDSTPKPAIYPEGTKPGNPRTQLQQQAVQLVHIQTNTAIDLPPTLELIHMGKPNKRMPPHIDVSSFPNAEVVSRVHADIRIEGGHYFIEDAGSSNGTYINNVPLLPGNQHRLRSGDRIALGKGNLVTFLFQIN